MQKAAKSTFSSRRLSTVWLWLGAASLLTIGLVLVSVNGSLDAEMASALSNQRIHVEKLTAVRRGARSVHVALLERWLYPTSERAERQPRIEKAVAAVRIGIDPTAHRGGTGLGLSIVRSLVELLGGDVRMESTLGQGTRVTVTVLSAARVGNSAVGGNASDRYDERSASPGPIQG